MNVNRWMAGAPEKVIDALANVGTPIRQEKRQLISTFGEREVVWMNDVVGGLFARSMIKVIANPKQNGAESICARKAPPKVSDTGGPGSPYEGT